MTLPISSFSHFCIDPLSLNSIATFQLFFPSFSHAFYFFLVFDPCGDLGGLSLTVFSFFLFGERVYGWPWRGCALYLLITQSSTSSTSQDTKDSTSPAFLLDLVFLFYFILSDCTSCEKNSIVKHCSPFIFLHNFHLWLVLFNVLSLSLLFQTVLFGLWWMPFQTMLLLCCCYGFSVLLSVIETVKEKRW